MANGIYIGDKNDNAREIATKLLIGDKNNRARVIAKILVGDRTNRARLVYSAIQDFPPIPDEPIYPDEPKSTVSTLEVGSSVYMNVDGKRTEFLVVHQGKPHDSYDDESDGTWIISKEFFDKTLGSENYESGTHVYLNTYFNKLDENIQQCIKSPTFTIYEETAEDGGSTAIIHPYEYDLTCRVFLLDDFEVSTGLSYFQSNASRKMSDNWWLRSPMCLSVNDDEGWWTTTHRARVNKNGEIDNYNTAVMASLRPAMILHRSTIIDDDFNIVGEIIAPEEPITVTFTVDGTNYSVDLGTTWGEWASTTNTWQPDNLGLIISDDYIMAIKRDDTKDYVYANEVITSGVYYYDSYVVNFTIDGISYSKDFPVWWDFADNNPSFEYDAEGVKSVETGAYIIDSEGNRVDPYSWIENGGVYTFITPELFSFYIDDTPYQAIVGMTWEEWTNSEYSPGHIGVEGDSIFSDKNKEYICYIGDDGMGYVTVTVNEEIIADMSYCSENNILYCMNNCGKYYTSDTGYNDEFCSESCHDQYYELNDGPWDCSENGHAWVPDETDPSISYCAYCTAMKTN